MTPLAIYVHWPFCRSKCPYCDFNSHVAAELEQARWCAAYRAALARTGDGHGGRLVTSVFFGGGTPSLMAPGTVAALLKAIEARWPTAPDLEVTLEANPTSVEAAAFAAFRAAGVNRLSVGVQALNDADLRALGRQHDAAEALAALDLAARAFPRVSFDLIYARPGQTVAAWRRELARAAALGTGHLSVYQLTLEAGTAFHRRHQRGEIATPDEDTAADLYEATQALLEDAGLPAYEISNHARPGEECRHNLTYWQGGDWLGIGPGAQGRLTRPDGRRLALDTIRDPAAWLAAVEAGGDGGRPAESLSPPERLTERLLMGLRLTAGVDRASLRGEFGRDLETLLPPRALGRLIAGGFLSLDAQTLAATPAGRQRLDAVLAALTAELIL
ncbi:MAG: radical SAM family heme chaperone HemW [Rhodospirillaceae bacterium]